MKKVAIYICGQVAKKCTANGCLRAFNEKKESFQIYEQEGCQLVSFNNCNGCDEDPVESLKRKIEKFQKAEVDVVHLSTCIRGRCEHYEQFAKELSKYFDVIGYTHGSAEGKKNNNINMNKNINKNIVLIGMPGCGKTTIGTLLAERRNIKFCDIDEYIEEREGRSIAEIFQHGEDFFREIERKAVEEVSKDSSMVISTGGGVVKDAINMERLKKSGILVFIDRSVEDIISDLNISDRPLLKDGKEKIYTLYKERYMLYKKYCDYEIINDTELQIVMDRIIACLN